MTNQRKIISPALSQPMLRGVRAPVISWYGLQAKRNNLAHRNDSLFSPQGSD